MTESLVICDCPACGLDRLIEGQKVEHEVVTDRRTRKTSADNIKKID